MSVSRSVAEILSEHVTLEIEGIDRMYLNVYVPALQRAGGVASFFRFHRGHQFASSALMDPITKAFIAQMELFAKQEQVPLSCCLKRARQRRYGGRLSQEVHRTGRCIVHRQGAGENTCVPHRAAAQ